MRRLNIVAYLTAENLVLRQQLIRCGTRPSVAPPPPIHGELLKLGIEISER